MHTSRILGEWSNPIGYKMGSSLARIYTTTKTSSVDNFKHRCKNYMVANMETLFTRGVLWIQVSRAISNPRTRNLASGELQPVAFFWIFFTILSATLTIASNNLVLG